jgi:predicted metalloprotease with PDZ domain
MTSRIFRSTLVVLLCSAFALHAEEAKKQCSSTAQECEREIRRMLSGRRYLGLQVVELQHGGILVKTINTDGPAFHEDFKEGDRIIAVNGRDMTLATVKEFKQTLADAKETGVLFVIVQRRGAYRKVDARLDSYPKAQIDKIIAQHLLQFHSVQSQTSSAQP